MITKRYNLINNVGGWFVFIIALISYWLTLEPTASYWDCGEFIIQADKLEVGHPPGNPIFMLTARFFANFAPSQEYVSLMVNAMSGLLSALTILLLFWTITHMVRRLVVRDGQTSEISLRQYIAIMGAGLVGSLAYAWSDTFWFSAVEGEVYAFSSFCTALVFWLILKWENRADQPHSDRYIILIAYIIGVSVAVHLLNLLCIPAIVLVFAYRRFSNMNLRKSLLALAMSFVIIVLVLYGLVPGFIKVAQQFELLFVNSFGFGFNSGVIIYAVLTCTVFIWCLYTLEKQKSPKLMKISSIMAVAFSGMLCFGNTPWIWILILAAFAAVLFWFTGHKGFPVRIVSVIMWSITVIFVGYSSYALILIRSSADTPMNQNSPDNVFDLASYLNREQYGENPLLYGETFNSGTRKTLLGYEERNLGTYEGKPVIVSQPVYRPVINPGKALYAKGVNGAEPYSPDGFLNDGDKLSNSTHASKGGDYYVKKDYKSLPEMNPELNMIFPRLYSRLHKNAYSTWVTGLDDPATMAANSVEIMAEDAETGEKVPELDVNGDYEVSPMGTIVFKPKMVFKPTYGQNLEYFLNYQLSHMYFRYFMWNFAGRQNDICNQYGEKDAGNWISGIPFIDNTRLGDQSKLPDDLGKNNRGHNVFYMLPLLLGIIGLLWQAFCGTRGIEQFWIVFFLFFMTGIAIVLYLNQTPLQPRERDYAFAGSFYAFAIWIGMGVPALWRIFLYLLSPKKKRPAEEPVQIKAIVDEPADKVKKSLYCVVTAAVIGVFIPLQMVSQTWDDHDRSGRYAARDFAVNYLESLEPDAIVFCNGDNDTFPLWYAQEVEGVRPDVKIINLSYLNSDWYANQSRMPSYSALPVKFTAKPSDYAYNKLDAVIIGDGDSSVNLLDALRLAYKGYGTDRYGYPALPSGKVYIPVDKAAVLKKGLVAPEDADKIVDRIEVDLSEASAVKSKGYVSLGEILMLDIIATNAAEGWSRPIYWASTVGDEYHVGLTPYMRAVGMVHQIVPTIQTDKNARTDRSYNVVMNKYRFGGADIPVGKKAPYFDETASRMLASVRGTMLITADELLAEGDELETAGKKEKAHDKYLKALAVAKRMDNNLPERVRPYELQIGPALAEIYCKLGQSSRLNDKKLLEEGLSLFRNILTRYAQYVEYEQEMRITFGNNASLSYETRVIPYRFYSFVEMYREYGGNMKQLLAIPAIKRLNMKNLEKNWKDLQKNYSSGEGQDDEVSQLAQIALIVNSLAAMSPEEYAAQGAESRLYDSIFYSAYQGVLEMGYSEEELRSDPEIGKVDLARSKRLDAEIRRNSPQYFE